MKLGGGGRFAAIAAKAKAAGAKDPNAVAAAAGIGKYGKHGMSLLAHKGTAAARLVHARHGKK